MFVPLLLFGPVLDLAHSNRISRFVKPAIVKIGLDWRVLKWYYLAHYSVMSLNQPV